MTDIAKIENHLLALPDKDADVRWPNDMPGAGYDWIEFSLPGDPDEHGELLRVKVNVSFMLSTWKCIYGQGCPGVLISGATEDLGCCQIGVHMEASDDDYKRVRGYVEQLTEDDLDADLLADIRKNGWRYRDKSNEGESQIDGFPWHTRVVDGACVLANRAGGSTGKLGCSLHVLAARLGKHHSDTKPNICWQIPLSVSTEYDENADQSTMTVEGSTGAAWGMTNPTSNQGPGWFCTETPDAYVIGSKCSCGTPGTGNYDGPQMDCPVHGEHVDQGMVFRTNEYELRKLMTDPVYDKMAEYLMAILKQGGRRMKMPGETINDGRPLIPLMVQKRFNQWADDETEEGEDALRRSIPYMRKHGCAPSTNYKVPKLLKRPVLAIDSGKTNGFHSVPPIEFSGGVADETSGFDGELSPNATKPTGADCSGGLRLLTGCCREGSDNARTDERTHSLHRSVYIHPEFDLAFSAQ